MSKAENKDDKTKDDKPKKTLSLGSKGTLSLGSGAKPKAVGAGGASNTVSVEVRRSKRANPAGASAPEELSNAQKQARARALEAAKAQSQKTDAALPKRVTLEDARRKKDEERAARQKEIEELDKQKAEREKERAAKGEPPVVEAPAKADHTPSHMKAYRSGPLKPASETEREKQKKTHKTARRTIDRVGGRMTVNQALNRDYEKDRGPSMAAQKRARERARMAAKGEIETVKVIRDVIIPEAITVQELSKRMGEAGRDVVKALMKLGVMATITQTIDADTAELIVEEFGHKIQRVTEADVEIGMEGSDDDEKDLKPRPPVVTIMGHVDHGKTSLLDALRKTDVASGEAGGITQHIGAYQVNMKSGDKITFLDTPGHAAFTEMRARGANVTDIVVIVVSATDSVMPQTIEAINHAKAAEVPIIIAVNKIDLPEADAQKVKTQLLQYEVIVEELSGDVQCVEISALKKTNLDKLEEAILMQAELLELKANPDREAHGFVVEARLDKGRGAVATVLVQNGTLNIGDVFVVGAETGKVRALISDHGQQIKTAIPGQPVEVLGLNSAPNAGDPFTVVTDEAKAREISEYRQRARKKTAAANVISSRVTMDDILMEREFGTTSQLPVIIKADVHGSIEAIAGSFAQMSKDNEGVNVQILHSGVGGITESDVTLASASNAVIMGFNVRTNAQARELAQKEGTDVRYYRVIYDIIDDAKALLGGMMEPIKREEYLGQALIQEVFHINKVGKVAGCMVNSGSVKRGSHVRLLRDDVVVHEGMLKTLKRHKDEVKDVKEGMECGMAFENYDDLKKGDIIECFEVIFDKQVVK